MPSWNPDLLIFNDSICSKSVAQRDFLGKYLVSRSSQASRKYSARQYFNVNLSGLMLTERQLQELRALELLTRYESPFLLRLSSYCLLEDADKNAMFLGSGGGTFPVFKRSGVQGRQVTDRITYLNYDYPDLEDLNGEDWEPMPEIQVWSAKPTWNVRLQAFEGSDVTGSCTIDRDLGTVTTPGGQSWITGGFYWLMECRQGIGVTPIGECMFEIDEGVQMVEPFPVGGEVLG